MPSCVTKKNSFEDKAQRKIMLVPVEKAPAHQNLGQGKEGWQMKRHLVGKRKKERKLQHIQHSCFFTWLPQILEIQQQQDQPCYLPMNLPVLTIYGDIYDNHFYWSQKMHDDAKPVRRVVIRIEMRFTALLSRQSIPEIFFTVGPRFETTFTSQILQA